VASDVNAAKEALSFTLKKEGYESQTIYVPGSLTEKSVDINVALTKNAVSGDPKKFDETLNALASAVADVQKDIQKKDYSFAEQKLTNLITEYPNVSTLYSLLGNISYLERRIEKALVYYKKAQSLSPNSVELQKIVERLEGISSGGTK
jgi:predicted Zn-dependent protease